MVAALFNPAQILNSYRKTDAVVIVCQNNTKKVIEITAINDEAAHVTGYSNEDLLGKPLAAILPERVSSTITEFVEFADDKNDLFFVLSKIRNFALKTRDGREIEFKLRIIHGESIDHNPWFHLVLVDEEKLRKVNAFRTLIQENFKGHEVIDEHTGLPDRASLIKDLEMIVYHVQSKEISASFAVIDINDYEGQREKYGQETCYKLHQHIGRICKMKMRVEDTIGSLSDRSLGIILIDAPQDPAHMVLNRLRWAIGVSPMPMTAKQDLVAQVNIGFAQIDGQIGYLEVLGKCEAFVESLRRNMNNSIQLVVTHERRDLPDRRTEDIPVKVERRKKNRRKPGDPEVPQV